MDETIWSNALEFEWSNRTFLHPVGLCAIAVLGVAMLCVPRRYAVLPMIVMACFIPSGQRLTVFTLDFSLLRIMVLFGWMRILLRREHRAWVWKFLDGILVLWSISGVIATAVRCQAVPPVISRLGDMFDAVGLYFLFRCIVRDWRDIDAIVEGIILVSVPVAAAFVVENATGRNLFSVFGGVPEVTFVREGRLRCQGAFSHPILAGCFWASLMPLVASQWWTGPNSRKWAVVGVLTSGMIILFSGSSTPVMAVLAGLLGACLFPLRYHMQWVRRCVVLGLLALHMVMNHPVWHLLARIDIVGGSTGWHRFFLIDQAIKRFGEWWLVGTVSTARWDEYGLLWDVTNQYVSEGVRGGVLTLALFLVIIGLAFRSVGYAHRAVRRNARKVVMVWALGVALFVHCVNFLAVSYFGQVILAWYLLLAMIASVAPVHGMGPRRAHRTVPATPARRDGGKPAGIQIVPLGGVLLQSELEKPAV